MTRLEPRLSGAFLILCRANFNKLPQQFTGEHGGIPAKFSNDLSY
jgi:hypothetical protein